MWIASLALIVIGIVLTINLAMIRPVGFLFLGVGGFGMIWSITNLDKWKDKEKGDEDQKKFHN